MAPQPGSDIPKAYKASDVESRIYQSWMDAGYFTPTPDPYKVPFVIIMPPPNVTGELHLGHALTASIEDILTRWHRMMGDPTLWLPGKDHAGIATQWVVEQQLGREGTSRYEIGREKFEERVWEWVRLYGNRIDEQHKRLGTSCDWTRLSFTLDPGPSLAVRTTFENLYNEGLIYKGERIINWCPRCSTALSDLEVEHEELEGGLYYIRYPMADGSGSVTVATTRPETMLGDTGVAVSPNDERYAGLIGGNLVLPIIGRELPVVADDAIDPEFGTGALKVTPAHDPVDFEIGQRHGLEQVTVIGLDGTMTPDAGPYQGQDRFEARKGVVAQLESEGFLERQEAHRHAVGHCQRCNTVVEPLVSAQWFMNVGHHTDPDSVAGRAYSAVDEGRIRIIPERFGAVYRNWLENIRDWCVSRQLWWGHRIPVWYCSACGKEFAAVEDPAECIGCKSTQIEQDPDVLDTWFSSGLWTHSTLGWPTDNGDMGYFYPWPDHDHATMGHDSFVMETGYDILFFWVARMIMMGLVNTDREPFHTVFLHGLIRDAQGVKMSKTRGNVVDPLQLLDEYGADALRFALTTGTAPGNDLRIGESKLESSRNFANKLWNASRFVMSSLEGADQDLLKGWFDGELADDAPRQDRWIIHRLNEVTGAVQENLKAYEFGEAQREVYEFLWGDYCDWYIELSKIRLRAGDSSPLRILSHVLERTLRLLHPFMPFITEEVWKNLRSRLPDEGGLPESIMIAPYPTYDESRVYESSNRDMTALISAIRAIRNGRAQLRLPAGQMLEATIAANSMREAVDEEAESIKALARVSPLHIVDSRAESPNGDREAAQAMTLVVDPLVVTLPLEGLVDLAAERERLEKEMKECVSNLQRVETLLSNPNFVAKAKEEVVEQERERLQGLSDRRVRLGEALEQLRV